MSDSVRPHRRQPTRLPCPWDSPGKNTGVGCHFLLQCMKVKKESEVAQLCLTLSDPMDCSLPGSSAMGFSRQEYWSGVPLREKAWRANLTPCFVGFGHIFPFLKEEEDISQKITRRLIGALILQNGGKEGLIWFDNCGSNGEMAFSADARSINTSVIASGFPSTHRKVLSIFFLFISNSFYYSPEKIYFFIYHDQIFPYAHMCT